MRLRCPPRPQIILRLFRVRGGGARPPPAWCPLKTTHAALVVEVYVRCHVPFVRPMYALLLVFVWFVYGAFGVLMSWLSAGTTTLGVEALC